MLSVLARNVIYQARDGLRNIIRLALLSTRSYTPSSSLHPCPHRTCTPEDQSFPDLLCFTRNMIFLYFPFCALAFSLFSHRPQDVFKNCLANAFYDPDHSLPCLHVSRAELWSSVRESNLRSRDMLYANALLSPVQRSPETC